MSQRFDCLLPVFIRQLGWLVTRHHLNHNGRLWLVHFDPHCSSEKLLVRCCTTLLLCFLIVGIHTSGISIALSLLLLLVWSLMWIAYMTLRVYQWESRSINFTSFQSRYWPVLWACSEMAEVWVPASCISLSCSLILSCINPPVSPM